jgi:hypothetical protein
MLATGSIPHRVLKALVNQHPKLTAGLHVLTTCSLLHIGDAGGTGGGWCRRGACPQRCDDQPGEHSRGEGTPNPACSQLHATYWHIHLQPPTVCMCTELAPLQTLYTTGW